MSKPFRGDTSVLRASAFLTRLLLEHGALTAEAQSENPRAPLLSILTATGSGILGTHHLELPRLVSLSHTWKAKLVLLSCIQTDFSFHQGSDLPHLLRAGAREAGEEGERGGAGGNTLGRLRAQQEPSLITRPKEHQLPREIPGVRWRRSASFFNKTWRMMLIITVGVWRAGYL